MPLIASPMRWTRSAFVEPAMPGGLPATMTTCVALVAPADRRAGRWSTCSTISSVCSTIGDEERLDAPGQRELDAHRPGRA